MNGYVYSGVLDVKSLEKFLRSDFEDATIMSWNLTTLDFSDEIRDSGIAFTEKVEIRWEKKATDEYRVIILSDEPIMVAEGMLNRLEGDWEVVEFQTKLINTSHIQFFPQFTEYPDQLKDKIRTKAFFKNSLLMFISLRRG